MKRLSVRFLGFVLCMGLFFPQASLVQGALGENILLQKEPKKAFFSSRKSVGIGFGIVTLLGVWAYYKFFSNKNILKEQELSNTDLDTDFAKIMQTTDFFKNKLVYELTQVDKKTILNNLGDIFYKNKKIETLPEIKAVLDGQIEELENQLFEKHKKTALMIMLHYLMKKKEKPNEFVKLVQMTSFCKLDVSLTVREDSPDEIEQAPSGYEKNETSKTRFVRECIQVQESFVFENDKKKFHKFFLDNTYNFFIKESGSNDILKNVEGFCNFSYTQSKWLFWSELKKFNFGSQASNAHIKLLEAYLKLRVIQAKL